MKKSFLSFILLFALAVSLLLTGCSKVTGGSAAQIEKTYICSETSLEGEFRVSAVYSLELYDDKTYKMTKCESTFTKEDTSVSVGTFITDGTYLISDSSIEGKRTVTLSVPERVICNIYSDADGYTFDFDTDTDEQYILPESTETAVNKEEFLEYYGYNRDMTVYIIVNSKGEDTCRFSVK